MLKPCRWGRSCGLQFGEHVVTKTGEIGPEFIDLWIKDKAAGEDIARQLQAPLLATNDSHYTHASDHLAHGAH